mmetsp:Transcript_30593/g.42594  ORF Transcript_30593/g.42594 Transcript_30593/m.42594 type:complete len:354 (-) Transcript_30593:424-1485(-)
MRSHQLVEAHVRCYMVSRWPAYDDNDDHGDDDEVDARHHHHFGESKTAVEDNDRNTEDHREALSNASSGSDEGMRRRLSSEMNHQGKKKKGKKRRMVYLQQQALRLQVPDDELGAMLFLGLPSVVVHRIDAWSPFLPKHKNNTCRAKAFFPHGSSHLRHHHHHHHHHPGSNPPPHNPRYEHRFPDILQRASDVDVGEREGALPSSGSSSSTTTTTTYAAAPKKASANTAEEEKKQGSGLEAKAQRLPQQHRKTPTKTTKLSGGEAGAQSTDDEIAEYLKDVKAEVLVVVEGIDPVTSNTASKIHSYTSEDIVFGRRFAACAVENEDGVCEVDFERFHALVGENEQLGRPEVQS